VDFVKDLCDVSDNLPFDRLSQKQESATPGEFRSWVERETGLEPATPCLEGRNSTTELLPRDPTYFTPNLAVGKQEEASVFTM
jgi:hypothetical protein